MEYIDILDENGIPTGQTATRKEVHEKGLWHRAVLCVIVDNKNRILIQQRSADKEKYPNKWDLSVAGHVSSGMGALSAVYTETMEEIGLQIPIRDFKYVTSFRDQRKLSDTFIENQFYDLFVLNLNISLTEINIQLDEVQAVDFKNPFEIKEMVKKGLFHPRVQWVDIIYKFLTNPF